MLRLWNPFDDLMRFDRWFTPSFLGFEGVNPSPAVEVRGGDDEYVIQADLPGMKPEDVEIELQGNLLTISGERRAEGTPSDGYERRYRAFSRTFVLPKDVKLDEATAELENGVLTVHLPKSEEARTRRIEVRSRTPELSTGESVGAQPRAAQIPAAE
ncbi:MAG TPA: Hsp20/alpha crystallin family protein [Polyangiaceae bacterium]|nr:Hsp20/alpha crystallin family protein [Polyangiaceae bacterium]